MYTVSQELTDEECSLSITVIEKLMSKQLYLSAANSLDVGLGYVWKVSCVCCTDASLLYFLRYVFCCFR